MDAEIFAAIAAELDSSLKPYKEGYEKFDQLPDEGLDREQILAMMENFKQLEASRWEDGYVSGAVYHGNEVHIDFMNRVYAINSQSNPLHPEIWPSTSKFDAEVVAMTANMLSADQAPEEIVGTVTSGGTESILLAMKAYRDWARETKGIDEPEVVTPTTAHAAFTKAGDYFGIKIVRIPVGVDFRADVSATRDEINENTIALVGSAPPFPHGIVDPIEQLSELALQHQIGFHTDACLGGFILPWAEKLGYDIPPFDFRLPGVTSISVDTHKYGYAAKGTSVILYRGTELRHYQYFSVTDWPGGFYASPTFAGSRPGGLIAAAWAAMVSMGEQGYLDTARSILETTSWINNELRKIDEIEVIGDPPFMVTFRSERLNVYQILEYMTQRGWGLSGLHLPPCAHLCVTLRHTQEGIKERFLEDMKAAIEYVQDHPEASDGLGPIYGMAAAVETRGLVKSVFNWFLDMLYSL
ncbi:MAG: aminotransferase class V-fold PLP-dependent enzyme [Anaerolineales bacterium]|nr:aminotransferase class V-fold PLP-dependent enzyme [Anaerolineales bacterium]